MKPPKPLDACALPSLVLPLYVLVPGAPEENVGVGVKADLKDGGGPAGGGGRGGRDACGCGVEDEVGG